MQFPFQYGHEFQFLFYLIPVVLGTQLAFFFFYQYYKIQDVNLKLNRILLSFGAFTFFLVYGALFLNVQRLFGGEATDIFNRIGWAFALSGPIGFLAFITIEEFSAIMNLAFVKLVIALGFIPIVIILIFGVSPIFMVSLVFAVLGAYYIIGFQIKLIRRTMGTIRKKFLQFFSGELLSFASLPFAVTVGLGIFESPIREIVYYMGVSILGIGFLILFFSANDFPPFYEFEWKDNLLKLFIINQKDNSLLYYCNVEDLIEQVKYPEKIKSDSSQERRDLIFSGGIAGIESVISKVTDTESERINIIKQEDSFILLDYGKEFPITYALIVKKDLVSLLHLLKSLKNNFERLYREILLNLGNLKGTQEQLFGGFDAIIDIVLNR